MHSHVIRTTTRELADCLDEWTPKSTAVREHVQVTPHYVGGRDWVVTVLHEHAPATRRGAVTPSEKHGHDLGDYVPTPGERPEALDEIGQPEGIVPTDEAVVGPLRVSVNSGHPVVDGAVMPSDYAAYVEDERRTWIMWIGTNGRPLMLWLRREEGGGVVEPGLRFRDDLPGGPGQLEMTTAQPLAPDDPGPHKWSHGEPGSEEYLQWALRERTYLYGETASARDSLRVLGWPDAENVTVPLHAGIAWLAEREQDDKGRLSSAAAYTDAVAALHERTGTPLSTTLGHLIRTGSLAPVMPPSGRYTVRWQDGGLTVDPVPVPGGGWETMRYMPVHGVERYDETMRADLVNAVIATIASVTGVQVDEG